MKLLRIFLGLVLLTQSLLVIDTASAQIQQTTTCSQAKPVIEKPQPGTYSGPIDILISICKPVTNGYMHLFFKNMGTSTEYTFTVPQIQGLYFGYSLSTTSLPNGDYGLYAAFTYYEQGTFPITTYSTRYFPVISISNSTGSTTNVTGNNTTTSSTPTPRPKTTTPGSINPATPVANPTATPVPNAASSPIARASATPISQAAVTAATPPAIEPKLELYQNSELVDEIRFRLDQEKPVHLEAVQERARENSKFIYFTGKSYPDSNVKITINSQPLVLSAVADSSGNWTYTLEDPLEPGEHKTYIEVANSSGGIDKSGPYSFSIARAAGSLDPNGNSYDLQSPAKSFITNYLYYGGIIILIAALFTSVFFLFRRKKLKAVQSQPL